MTFANLMTGFFSNRPTIHRAISIGALVLLAGVSGFAQRGGAAPAGPPPTPKAAAAIDLTGYWVSLVTEDWRYRMATAPKGDFVGVPLNAEGKTVAEAWDPAKDQAAGEVCKAFGVGGVMRMPTRLHIQWVDDNTLKIETDAGTQTRLLHFNTPQGQGGDWQGLSVATWQRSISVMGAGRGGSPPGASLKVVTTKMKPGYLRRNGIPYSGNAVVTEYFDRLEHANDDPLLVVSTEVVDPAYLATPFWTSTHFKKQKDATGWNPTPCSAR